VAFDTKDTNLSRFGPLNMKSETSIRFTNGRLYEVDIDELIYSGMILCMSVVDGCLHVL
jgi:hypothetical protein